jgi:hypothetical protein
MIPACRVAQTLLEQYGVIATDYEFQMGAGDYDKCDT